MWEPEIFPNRHNKKHWRCTFSDGAESCLSYMFNQKQEALTSTEQGHDWSPDMKPNKQSQQAAKKKQMYTELRLQGCGTEYTR